MSGESGLVRMTRTGESKPVASIRLSPMPTLGEQTPPVPEVSHVEHVVFFPAPDGSPAFRRLPSLEEAVDFVEHLRNEQEIREVSIHALNEVPLAFRTVYRVEVAGSVPTPAEPESADAIAPADADASAGESAADLPAADDVEVVAAGNGNAHSLGFFAG